jgi:hypothetical protein
MLYVALALVACNALAVATFAQIVARMQRAHARREALLVNQLLALAGKPWEPPPAWEEPEPEIVQHEPYLIANPEQLA